MPNFKDFTGIQGLSGFYKHVGNILLINELGGVSDGYRLSQAGGNSGYSFGGNQMDLSTNNVEYRNTFKDILVNARNTSGQLIFSNGAQFYDNNLSKITSTNPNAFSTSERSQIDQALSSAYGKTKINAAFVDEVNKFKIRRKHIWKRMLIALLFIFSFGSTASATEEKVLATIKKNNSIFYLKELSLLRKGLATIDFVLASNQSPEEESSKYEFVYSAIYNPIDGGCYSKSERQSLYRNGFRSLKYNYAYQAHKFLETDINNNKKNDYILFIKEQDCQTKKSHFRGVLVMDDTQIIKLESEN